MLITKLLSPLKPLRISAPQATKTQPTTLSDSVAIGEQPRFKLNKRQQHRLGLMAALALACMPAASSIIAPPSPVTYEVPADSWVAGVPGHDVVKTRLEGIELSQRSGHLNPQQAQQLRQRLENLPASGPELVNRLSQFDNLYDSYRFPSDPAGPPGAPETADPSMVNLIHQGFKLYDANGDRAVTRRELTTAMITTEDGKLGAPASAMSAMYGELAGNLNYISYSSLENPTLARYTDVSLRRQAGQPETRELSQESFDSSRIRQRFQGSCVLLSTLLELPPQHLREMITDNHNGTFTVHFRNGKEATVTDLTEAERSFYSTTFEGERWPGIFEKAVGTIRAQEGVGGGDMMTAGRTIPPAEAIALMTGRSAEFRRISALGPSGLRQFLIDAERRHEPIIAGISNTAGSTGLIGHHEYAVKGFNPVTNMVTLRNPHGQGVWNRSRLNENGLFEMSLSDFYSHYHNITALRDTPPAG